MQKHLLCIGGFTFGRRFVSPLILSSIVACPQNCDNNCTRNDWKLLQARDEAKKLLIEYRELDAIPGLSAAVMMDGKLVFAEGFGFADVENHVPMTATTLLRIASISKSLTTVALARLVDENKINIDQPIATYLPNITLGTTLNVPSDQSEITCRKLAGHLAGVRHYKGDELKSKVPYNTVNDALNSFRSDALITETGNYLYTTHGFTVLSAVMEAAYGQPFLKLVEQQVLHPLQLAQTLPETHSTIIPGRGRQYLRNSKHVLENTPFVDQSLKWAGGGYLSTATDLVHLGHALLHSDETFIDGKPFLTQKTREDFWKSQIDRNGRETKYGVGFMLHKNNKARGLLSDKFVGHSGGAVGVTSQWLMFPKDDVVAVIIVNTEGAPGVYNATVKLAEIFGKNKSL